jgi:hypothetical protein
MQRKRRKNRWRRSREEEIIRRQSRRREGYRRWRSRKRKIRGRRSRRRRLEYKGAGGKVSRDGVGDVR